MKQNVKNLVLVILALTMGISISCDSSKFQNDTTSKEETVEQNKKSEKFVAGELGYLTDNCIGVVDKEDMSDVMKFLKANDMTGIQQMVAAGKATTFAAGKQVKVIDVGFDYIQVRDVNSTEMLVWIPKNMLTHEDIWGVYTSTN